MNHPPTRPARASEAIGTGWRRTLARRIGTHTLLKASATVLGIAVFFAAYFWVLHHPQGPVTTMPALALDHWLAFEFSAMPLYLSLWAYVSLAPALLPDRAALIGHALGCTTIAAVGLVIFLVWPTRVPPLGAEAAAHAGMAMLRGIDLSGNACPSLHVAFAVFAAASLAHELRAVAAPRWLRAASLLWCAGIVYSTIATRQHVVLDVLAGAALGGLVAALNGVWSRGADERRAALAPRPFQISSAVGEP